MILIVIIKKKYKTHRNIHYLDTKLNKLTVSAD